MRVRDIHSFSQAVMGVILNTVSCDDSFEDKVSRITGCETILHQLSSQKCGLNIILRFLLDACLNTRFCIWIGGSLSDDDSSVRQKTAVSLLHSNYKHGTKPVQPLGSTVTYHAGVTIKVLDLMAVGQFIPAQLSLVPHIIQILDPFQLHCILIDIWNFMKNYVPGPSLYVTTDQESGQMTRVFGHYK